MADLTGIISSLWPMLPGLVVGGVTVGKLMAVAGKIVLALGQQEIEDEEKREQAIAELYERLPVLSRIVPKRVLIVIVEVVWREVVKPALLAPPPVPKG